MSGRHLTAIFCDDIRHEVGGKFSFMGCYTSALFVAQVPVVLPKLCVHTILETRADDHYKSVQMLLRRDGVTMAQYDLAVDEGSFGETANGQPARVHYLYGGLTLTPLEINGPSMLEVVAVVDGEEILGGRLLLQELPSTEK